MRTLALVSLGSTVFTMVNVAVDYRSPIAAQVVSGIGFLGAGVILRGPYGITGLTSAATIWSMAAVGMTVGIGYGGAGLALSLFQLAAMLMVSLGEQRYIGPCRHRWAVADLPRGGRQEPRQDRGGARRIPRCAQRHRAARAPGGPRDQRPPHGQLRLRYCDAHRHHREFLAYPGEHARDRGNPPRAGRFARHCPAGHRPSAMTDPSPSPTAPTATSSDTPRGRRGPAQTRSAYPPGGLVARAGPAGPGATADRGERRANGGFAADQMGPDGRFAFRLFPGRGGIDGHGPRGPTHDGAKRAALRRCPCAQPRGLRCARRPSRVRSQRLRRNPRRRAVGMGCQAAGRESRPGQPRGRGPGR